MGSDFNTGRELSVCVYPSKGKQPGVVSADVPWRGPNVTLSHIRLVNPSLASTMVGLTVGCEGSQTPMN
jgi:hypothetical protein